jgi:hypothetical protein
MSTTQAFGDELDIAELRGNILFPASWTMTLFLPLSTLTLVIVPLEWEARSRSKPAYPRLEPGSESPVLVSLLTIGTASRLSEVLVTSPDFHVSEIFSV